ncbi:hypothetical protein C8R46DRAFT_1085479 [Mycena filopes]|nr:hypothetical protein C8R46DRAFT_1085479 [Mycena filopes]
MPDTKPLPAIPHQVLATVPNLTTLSIDARNHRARFIRAILAEAELADAEEWAAALEDALDGLSDAVGRGRWLAGVKRERGLRRPQREQHAFQPRRVLARTDTMASNASSAVSALQSIVSDASDHASSSTADSPTVEALRQIRALSAQPTLPNPKPAPKHLLLCLAPLGSRIAVPQEDSGFDLIPANLACVFKPGVFSLPEADEDDHSSILYGLAEWDAGSDVQLAGGTFGFKGITSPLQHHALCKALRISIYMHLSLLLEQHFLTNSGVRLDFPIPKLRHSAAISEQAAPESPPTSPPADSRPGPGQRHKTFLPGILSFFSKKNASLLHGHRPNSPTSASSTRTGASLDLSASSTYSSSRDSSAPASPRLSDDGGTGSRIRRFSFISASPTSFLPSSLSSAPSMSDNGHSKDAGKTPFTTLVARLSASAPLLSSSAGVRIAPPPLLIELAAKEALDPSRRLLGDEKAGLGSLLGWDAPLSVPDSTAPQISSKEARAKAMSGARGFARMQELSVLLSRHVPGAPLEVSATSATGSTSSLSEEREPVFAPCDRPYWTTWRYYGRGGESEGGDGKEGQGQDGDRSLGDMVSMLIKEAAAPCARAGCAFTQGEHVMRVVHGGVRVAVGVSPNEDDGDAKEKDADTKEKDGDAKETTEEEEDEERIEMWVSCALCSKESDRVAMNDGAYLFSFAKFLEVLIYSPAVCTLTPALCEHTSPSPPRPPISPTARSTATSSGSTYTTSTTSTSSTTTYNPNKNAKPTPVDPPQLPTSRFNIVRHFAVVRKDKREPGHTVSFRISAIEDDIFELRVPRLQITRKSGERGVRTSMVKDDGASVVSGVSETSGVSRASGVTGVSGVSGVSGTSGSTAGKTITGGHPTVEEEKRTLRREIKAWWEGVADHLDKLETNIVGSTLVGFRKALPRLPSVDDAYEDASTSASEDETDDDDDDEPSTPKMLKSHHQHLIAGLPPSAPTTPAIARSAQEFFPAPPLQRATSDPMTPSAVAEAIDGSPAPLAGDSLELLTSLRQTFHGAEQALYSQLAQTPVAALNDVRRAFVAAARGAERRLGAWQRKHVSGHGRGKSKSKHQQRGVPKLELSASEPEWWAKGCHTAPGGNIIIREDDWGSIIAFTMSTADYYRELASMSLVRSTSMSSLSSPQAVSTPTAATSTASSFFSSASTNYKLFSSSTQIQPDPDQDDAVWYEAEAYSAVISRKEHPRDATSLLSLREVLRQKSPMEGAASVLAGGSSRFGSLGSAATKASSGIAPPSAWSKPDVQITKHEAGGEVSGTAPAESAGKILQEIDANAVEGAAISRPSSAMSGNFLSGSMFADMGGKRRTPSIISVGSDSTIGGKSREGSIMDLTSEPESMRRHERDATETPAGHAGQSGPTPTPSSFTNTLTSGISSAMRFMLSTGEIPRPSMFSKNHHGLLAPADAFAIDERPHIKYDWTIGKRLKFSCTVYYAKQFDNLRKRCGIDDVFLKSLSRSANWAAEGGKSKSNFWKTADDRFIIKTLVNAWNVADLQVLIELAPSYFRYMDATASRATVLAKLIGFYTIEIRNLETGTVQSKADLLVMENLFYDQKIVKTFDLKGIQGRKVKSNASGTAQNVKTLFDGEWIEGQQRTLTLVRPHSKVVLREAIRSDAEFLAKSNIMDYSLLLGVDQERKQIACGLVDTIGSYTFAKTLEYKAKQGLNSGKEVTVIPPTEYQERFVSALDGYFLACPDKWSRSMDDSTKPVNDPALLPSVL